MSPRKISEQDTGCQFLIHSRNPNIDKLFVTTDDEKALRKPPFLVNPFTDKDIGLPRLFVVSI